MIGSTRVGSARREWRSISVMTVSGLEELSPGMGHADRSKSNQKHPANDLTSNIAAFRLLSCQVLVIHISMPERKTRECRLTAMA